jgi:hypothetical protein
MINTFKKTKNATNQCNYVKADKYIEEFLNTKLYKHTRKKYKNFSKNKLNKLISNYKYLANNCETYDKFDKPTILKNIALSNSFGNPRKVFKKYHNNLKKFGLNPSVEEKKILTQQMKYLEYLPNDLRMYLSSGSLKMIGGTAPVLIPIITTIAGTGTNSFSDGDLTTATLNGPQGVVVDAAGNVYIADKINNRIRLITKSTGVISTIAGTGTPGFSGDGDQAIKAKLSAPQGVALDAAGNVYIAVNNSNRLRKI